MSFNIQSPFLIPNRKFPQDKIELENVLTKSNTDTSIAVNARTIGLHELVQINIGDMYFNTGNPQNRRQSFRKMFAFGGIATGTTLTIDINSSSLITQFVLTEAEVITDTGRYRNLPYLSTTLITDQIQIDKTQTQVIITNGATAPNISSGTITLEYLLN